MLQKSWKQVLEEKHIIEQLRRDREMIYQCDAKEEYALLLGLRLTSLWHLTYWAWVALQKDVEEFKDEAWTAYSGTSKTMGEIWTAYALQYPEKIRKIVLDHNLKP